MSGSSVDGFGNFKGGALYSVFPLLTIIPWASNVCSHLHCCNSKLAPFSISACSTSMMIINTIETALVLIFGAIRLFRGSSFPWES